MKFFIIALMLWVLGTISNDWFAAGTLLQVSFSFFMLALYQAIPHTKPIYKYTAYLWACMCVANDLADPMVEYYGVNNEYYYTGAFLACIICLIYILFRNYKLPKDTYTGIGVYLKFKKPKNFVDFSISMIRRPVCSVSIIINKNHYRYKNGVPFYKTEYVKNNSDCLIRLNIPISETVKISTALDSFIGTIWSPYRNNCCKLAQTIINHKFSPLDAIPCIFLKTLEELKKNGNI